MPLLVLSKSSATKSHTFMSQEQQGTSPMNTDEALKSHHCFWQNPNYLESTLSRRYQSNFSVGSQRFSGQFLMIPNPGFVDISSMTNSQDTNPASFQPTNPKIILKEEKENEEQQYWTIKKELTKSNVAYGTCRRLTLSKSSVEEHILKHLLPEDSKKIDKGKPGITVKVYDHDTDTEHELCLAFQSSYVLKNGWVKTFIKRRGLEEGDKIGLFWECSTYKLHFSVLSRANTIAPA
ncbi:DNA-binding pseudobarrel domain superfamily [Arabidopsis suecica]|uniref:DNA-binding pseudobarrel domain superfamily n=1 Tax=Arabidopsis suecica TaxID=45249 RepID=A0A8T2BWH1_ARASU|nr:DNA-binding pseudobarrel domain superfamily [Arabidopsis suecica]